MKSSFAIACTLALATLAPAAEAVTLDPACASLNTPVTLEANARPRSDVLREVGEHIGRSVVITLPDDPSVTLFLRNVPAVDVFRAVLGPSAAMVSCESSFVSVHPMAAATPVQPAFPMIPAPPAVPSVPAVPAMPSMPAVPAIPAPPTPPASPAGPTGVPDRVTLGHDTVVAAGERVRDVVSMGGDVDVHGQVLGSVVTMGGDVHVFPGAKVHGDLVTAGGDVRVDPGGVVMGSQLGTGDASARIARRATTGSHDRDKDDHDLGIFRYAVLFLFALALLGGAPERYSALQRAAIRAPIRTAATGLLAAIGGLVVAVVLAITIIGIPAALVVLLLLPLAGYIGFAAMASVIGAALPVRGWKDRPIVQLAAGVTVLLVVSHIPVIGGLVLVLCALTGLGAVVLTRFGRSAPGDIDYRPFGSGPFRSPTA